MSLAQIPDGRVVLVDTNILLYHSSGNSNDIASFFDRCDNGAISGFLTSVVLAEFCDRLMMLEANRSGLTASNPARALSQRPELVRSLSQYSEKTGHLLEGGLFFETVQKEDFRRALELQNRYGLLTNDSLNLAVARRLAIKDIASADRNFDRITDIAVHKPELTSSRP